MLWGVLGALLLVGLIFAFRPQPVLVDLAHGEHRDARIPKIVPFALVEIACADNDHVVR